MPSKWFSSLHAAISALLRLAPVCGNGCGTRSLEQQISIGAEGNGGQWPCALVGQKKGEPKQDLKFDGLATRRTTEQSSEAQKHRPQLLDFQTTPGVQPSRLTWCDWPGDQWSSE
jgi:hypothetical protein